MQVPIIDFKCLGLVKNVIYRHDFFLNINSSFVFTVNNQVPDMRKTGPETGQCFHVPLALCIGYETREEYKGKPQIHKRNHIRSVPFLARVSP